VPELLKRSEPLDLENDLPTTAADVAALKQLRESHGMSFVDYLDFLSRYKPPPLVKRRKTHEGCEPFEL